MKILFCVPQSLNQKQMYLEYPMGAGYICTYLNHVGHITKIWDQNAEKASDRELLNVIEEFCPDIIAFSILTPCYPKAKIQAEFIKQSYPDIPVIAGGVHVTIFQEKLFHDGFDGIIIGEGEILFQELCLCYQKTKKLLDNAHIRVSPLSKIGTCHELNIQDKKQIYREELLLNRDVYNLNLYTHHSLLATRGCPFKCRFCCNYTRIFGVNWNRTIESVINELKLLEEKYHAKQAFFADDIFFLNKKNIIAFCKAYKEAGLKLEWVAQLRVNTVDRDTTDFMKSCGCKRVYYGIESGSQTILNECNKMITVEQIKESIKVAKDAHMRVKTGWIIGLPGSYSEQLKSLDIMLETMPNEISIHQLIPFPGTDYYDDPERYGIEILDKNNVDSFCYGGISDNFRYSYLSSDDYYKLLSTVISALEAAGYKSSDTATADDEFIYTSPLSMKSIQVFQNNHVSPKG